MDQASHCAAPGIRDDSWPAVRNLFWRQSSRRTTQLGITLIEVLVTVVIIAVMVGVSYPTLTSGLDGIRLRTSISQAGTFFSRARLQATRTQNPVQFVIDPKKKQLMASAIEGGWHGKLQFEDGVYVVFPADYARLILYPGQPSPEFRLKLQNRAGTRIGLKINVLTGVPEKWSDNE